MRNIVMCFAVAGLAGALAAAQEAVDVAGEWTLTILDPLSINDEVPLVLEQDGADLAGTARDSIVAGTVDGQRIGMFYEVDTFQVGRITLAFTGTVAEDGQSMRGDVAFGRYASGTWSAERN